MKKTALLVGATGLVGSELLNLLVNDDNFSTITALTRKPLNIKNTKVNEVLVDFNTLENHSESIKADVVFCCLGTTIKTAGSKDAFKKVDYEYPLKIAKIAKQNGANTYNIITALGADKNSVFFYNKVKGEIQEALQNLGFEQLNIIQPSLLLGEREEKRMSEGIGQKLAPIFNNLMIGGLKKYRAIDGRQVAKAMLYYSLLQEKGIHYYTNDLLLIV